MSAHAEYAPSSLDLRETCPGFRPSGDRSAAADRGTDIHDAMARSLAGEAVDVPDEWAEQVAYGLDVYRRIAGRYLNAETLVEERLETPMHGVWGTADAVVVDSFGGVGAVIDWKTGMGQRKPAAESLQVAAYALGAAKKWRLDSVECWIVELDRKTASSVTFDREALEAALRRIRDVIKACREDEPLRYACGSWCRYCVRSVTCPAVQGAIVPATQHEIAKPAEYAAALAPGDVAAWLDRYGERIELAWEILRHVQARAHALIEGGVEVPGYALIPGRRTRKWADEASAAQALTAFVEASGMAPDSIYETSLLSPARAEKLGKDAKALVAGLVTVNTNPKLTRVESREERAA